MKIAVAGTGYVGLSIATLLSQHHEVMAVDIIPEKVDLINHKKSPIQDEYIEKYLAENGKPDMEKMELIVFDPIHHGYIELGKTVGHAFSDGKALKG